MGLLAVPLAHVAAQETGRIVGTIVEARTGEGLPGANVVVKGTYYGGTSDIEGNVPSKRTRIVHVEVSRWFRLVKFTV
jgi:hypothetical protein